MTIKFHSEAIKEFFEAAEYRAAIHTLHFSAFPKEERDEVARLASALFFETSDTVSDSSPF